MANQGALTKEDKEKVVAHLEAKASSLRCPACRQHNWSIGDHLLSPPVFVGGAIAIGGTNYPMVALVCNNCFNTQFFAAVPLGLTGQKVAGEKSGG